MKRTRPSDSIRKHGNMEALVRSESARWGWSAACNNLDCDPGRVDSFGRPAPAPGRGDVTLSRGDRAVSFPYHLPEDEEVIRRTVQRIVRADELESQRGASEGTASLGGV